MFTVCSKCNLRLTVTATDLRAAQGYVRCGRCHNVFNALAALADDPARLAEQVAAADTQTRQVLTQLQANLQGTPELPPKTAPAADDESTDTSLEFNPASTNINEVFIEAAASERTGTFESIILVSEPPTEALAEEPGIAPQALSDPLTPAPTEQSVRVDVQKMRDALAEPPLERPALIETRDSEIPVSVPPSTPPPVTAAPAPAPEDEYFIEGWTEPPAVEPAPLVEEPADIRAAVTEDVAHAPAPLLEAERSAPRLPRAVLQGAAGVLILCLVAQVVHHYRGALAETAALRGPLTATYLALGQPLEPRWDIASYDVRQLGASTDGAAAGDLVVRASIGNRAARVQPLPLLRVVMQDRFGNRVAARDLRPAEYLGRGAPQVSLMAPGQRVDVQVAFQDPGQAATGFEIDACMARRDHTVTCANDPSSR